MRRSRVPVERREALPGRRTTGPNGPPPKGLEAAIGPLSCRLRAITDDPSAFTLTQATEDRYVYSLDEIGTNCRGSVGATSCRSTWMAARFANAALSSLDCKRRPK